MTGLLVSVRNTEEAQQALCGGADVIDVKEPNRGALGAADPQVWRDIRDAIPSSFPLSVALGELVDNAMMERSSLIPGIQYAKVGLAGCLDVPDWRARWARAFERLPKDVHRVAVGYVDHATARAPDPRVVLQAASTAGCDTLLLDTFAKEGGNLFDHLDDQQLGLLASECATAGIDLVLAGSLQLNSIEHALTFAPTLIAVRGAACLGDRTETVSGALVKRLKQQITANFDGDLISR